MGLISTTTPDQSGPEGNGKEGVLYIPMIPRLEHHQVNW